MFCNRIHTPEPDILHMPARAKSSTTRLPQALRDQLASLDADGSGGRSRRGGGKPQMSRKETRKMERERKKQRKAKFYVHHGQQQLKRAADEHEEAPQRKRQKTDTSAPPLKASKPTTKPPEKTKMQSAPAVTKTPLAKMTSKSKAAPSSHTQKEKEEDAYIAYLEAKLGYSKEKSRKKEADDDDGLDDLLDFADSLGGLGGQASEDSELDLAASEEEEEGSDEDDGLGAMDDEHENGGDENSDADSEDLSEESGSEEGWGGIDAPLDAIEDGEAAAGSKSLASPDPPPAPTKYVPPHLRQNASSTSEAVLKITRQFKGLLNRMSEQNLGTILDSIEEIYRSNSRNDVTSTITTLIIDGISSHSTLLDSYVVLHAALVSSLQKIIGIEFAAYFVQHVVSSYEQQYSSLDATTSSPGDEEDSRGKECSNLIVLLSELYNFQVISCVLVFDVIRQLLQSDITEFNVELLLKIVRNSGQQLRQDDSSALKDIVQIVQDKVAKMDQASISSRTRFMVETLTNLKNKVGRRPAAAQSQDGGSVERMKKFLSALSKKRHVMSHEPLRVSLADLRSAEAKGKWWLVGAAWAGDPLVDNVASKDNHENGTKKNKQQNATSESAILKLARKQGMNTDIRRSVFVVIMSSDDYVDACERLAQLDLTELQQREIIRVLLHCCGNEKSYNPYYALIGQRLCRSSYSYKITIQFCLWDFLRDLGETNVGGAEVVKNLEDSEDFDTGKTISSARIRNVARAYAWWIAKDAVTLAVLKPVDFALVKPQTRTFLNELFSQIFFNSQTSTPVLSTTTTVDNSGGRGDRGPVEEIFVKAARIESLALGLVYFLGEMPKDTKAGEFVEWAATVAIDTLRTGIDVIPGL